MFQYSFEGTIESGKRKRITKGGYSTYEEAYQNGVKAKKEYDKCVKKLKEKNLLNQNKDNPCGYVYICKVAGKYKIGKANLGCKRLAEYTRLMETPKYFVLQCVNDRHYVEKLLKHLFTDKRIYREDGKCTEWFNLTEEELVIAIKTIQDYESIAPFKNEYVDTIHIEPLPSIEFNEKEKLRRISMYIIPLFNKGRMC
ncbi:MAG: GIY-YIG nuclease family protein [Agathobacter sp.]